MREIKTYQSNLRRHKKTQITEQTSPTLALTRFSSASLSSGKRRIELNKVKKSINTAKNSFVL